MRLNIFYIEKYGGGERIREGDREEGNERSKNRVISKVVLSWSMIPEKTHCLLSLTEDLKGRGHVVPEQPHKGRRKRNSFHLPLAFGSLVKVSPQVLACLLP